MILSAIRRIQYRVRAIERQTWHLVFASCFALYALHYALSR